VVIGLSGPTRFPWEIGTNLLKIWWISRIISAAGVFQPRQRETPVRADHRFKHVPWHIGRPSYLRRLAWGTSFYSELRGSQEPIVKTLDRQYRHRCAFAHGGLSRRRCFCRQPTVFSRFARIALVPTWPANADVQRICGAHWIECASATNESRRRRSIDIWISAISSAPPRVIDARPESDPSVGFMRRSAFPARRRSAAGLLFKLMDRGDELSLGRQDFVALAPETVGGGGPPAWRFAGARP